MNEAKDMAMEKRRTLIDAVDRLTAKANFAEEVAAQTFQLVDKFERTEGAIKEGIPTDGMGQKSARMPNIIDLFDILTDTAIVVMN